MDSVILRGKVIDKRNVTYRLQNNLTLLNVSYSWEGLGRFSDTLFCGVNKAEKTLHDLFTYNHFLPEIGVVTFAEIDTAVRLYARSKNVELGLSSYKAYLVTGNTINIAKKENSTAKWRAVVTEPNPMLTFEKGTITVPRDSERMLHIFYGEVEASAADLANRGGGGGATNVSKFHNIGKSISDMLVLTYNDSKGNLPEFVEMFSYDSSLSLKTLLNAAVEIVIDLGTLRPLSIGTKCNFRCIIYYNKTSS